MKKTVNYESFSKYQMIKNLISEGFSKGQSKVLFKTIYGIAPNYSKLASKSDIEDLKQEITSIKQEIEKSELRMIIKLGSVVALSISLLGSIGKYL